MSKAILLNTGWTFTKEGHDEPVTLPHTWNAVDGQDGGNDYYRGTCSYTRNLEKPELSDGDRAVLQFDGVAMTAKITKLSLVTSFPVSSFPSISFYAFALIL